MVLLLRESQSGRESGYICLKCKGSPLPTAKEVQILYILKHLLFQGRNAVIYISFNPCDGPAKKKLRIMPVLLVGKRRLRFPELSMSSKVTEIAC